MQNTTDQRIKALESKMNDRLRALADENRRLRRSTRRYARWSMCLIILAGVGLVSYAWAIDPLNESMGTPGPGEVKTGFQDNAVISAAEFNTSFASLVGKVNELVTDVNANTTEVSANASLGEVNYLRATSSPGVAYAIGAGFLPLTFSGSIDAQSTNSSDFNTTTGTFTPSVAGTYIITTSATSANWQGATDSILRLTKNATPHLAQAQSIPGASLGLRGVWIVRANGINDAFQVELRLFGNTGTVTLDADADDSYFKAVRVSGL